MLKDIHIVLENIVSAIFNVKVMVQQDYTKKRQYMCFTLSKRKQKYNLSFEDSSFFSF